MKSFHLYALITILCWSVGNTFTKNRSRLFQSMSACSFAICSCLCCFYRYRFQRKDEAATETRHPWFIIAGATGFFGFTLAFNKGCETVTASTASVILAAVPVMTALLANYIYTEKLKPAQWAAIAAEFCGVAIMTLMNGLEAVKPGMLWVLIAAISLSTYNLIVRHLTRRYTSLQTSAFSIFAGAILLMVFLPQAIGELSNAPLRPLLYIAFMGIFCKRSRLCDMGKGFF